MKKLLLVGGGGHCHSIIDSLLLLKAYDEIGIIDSTEEEYLGISFLGTDDDIPRLKREGWNEAFISVGSIGNTATRRRLYEMIIEFGLAIPTIIDPTSTIAKGSNIAKGTFIGKNVVVNSGTRIGEGCIINTGAIIEHDCMINDFSHISPGVVLCGQVMIGKDSHIGAGTVVRQQITVGDNVLIGAGSVVVKNIKDNVKAFGNPCRVRRK